MFVLESVLLQQLSLGPGCKALSPRKTSHLKTVVSSNFPSACLSRFRPAGLWASTLLASLCSLGQFLPRQCLAIVIVVRGRGRLLFSEFYLFMYDCCV